jgi:hypothetical protein
MYNREISSYYPPNSISPTFLIASSSFYHPFKCMYIYNVCISTFKFLTFLFTASKKNLNVFLSFSQCCFLLLLLPLLSIQFVYDEIYSVVQFFEIYIPFFYSYISIIIVIALEGNKCFQSYIFWRNSSENILIFFFCRLFLYLVISCFLNWFFLSCCFHLLWHIMLPPILVLFQFLTWINYNFFSFKHFHSFIWKKSYLQLFLSLAIDEKMDQSWIMADMMVLLIPSPLPSLSLCRFISSKDSAQLSYKIYSVNILSKYCRRWISLVEGTLNGWKENDSMIKYCQHRFLENSKK